MTGLRGLVLNLVVVILCGCATMPTGPSVMVLPTPGKPFEVFQSEELACRQWARLQTGAAPADMVNENLAAGAAMGTLMGAGLGAAIGSASGDAGTGAVIGAASGLIGGTAAASGPAYAAGWEGQRRYDIAYQQCMYAKGNQIPGLATASRRAYRVPPPPGFTPGATMPPPPGASSPSPAPKGWP